MKWKVLASATTNEDEPQVRTTSKPKEFKFSVDTNQSQLPWDTQT